MIAILSDIHSNIHALDAVLADMPEVSDILILGDMIGGLAFPCQVLDRIMNLSVPVSAVLGNWEEGLLDGKRGLHPEWWTEGAKFAALAYTADALQPHHWSFLESLDKTLNLDNIPGGALLYHGRPKNSRESILNKEEASEVAAEHKEKWLLSGHTHIARLFRTGSGADPGNQKVVGVGSVGLSMDRIGGTACYALLGEDLVFRHVAYNVEAAIKALESSSLAQCAPGFSRANALSMASGRNHIASLMNFCQAYDGSWEEAEKAWDGSECLEWRLR